MFQNWQLEVVMDSFIQNIVSSCYQHPTPDFHLHYQTNWLFVQRYHSLALNFCLNQWYQWCVFDYWLHWLVLFKLIHFIRFKIIHSMLSYILTHKMKKIQAMLSRLCETIWIQSLPYAASLHVVPGVGSQHVQSCMAQLE